MTDTFKHLTAIVFDWAGTTIDCGSRAPASVFQEIFRRRGVPITAAQAREPMGMAKRDHIAAVAAMPEVAAAWKAKYGAAIDAAGIDAMYADFLPLQKATLAAHCDLIPGVIETVALCRARGLKVGSSTGYTRELMEVVSEEARRQGYEPDCVACVEDAPRGRPAPYLLFEVAKRLDVYPLWTVVKVDDTPVGIEAGRNAGCWTIGITRTGNGVGLSREELETAPVEEVEQMCDAAARKLIAAGAHFTADSVADIMVHLDEIDRQLDKGRLPM